MFKTGRLLLTLWVCIHGGNWIYAYQSNIPLDLNSIEYGFSVKQYTKDDGLPMNSTMEILQHPNGFIYIATFDGLVRFDGYEFEIFDNSTNPELGRNRFKNIEVHPEKGLWVLDGSYSLYHFINDKFNYLNNEIDESIKIYDFIVSDQDYLILYTDKGLFEWAFNGSLTKKDNIDYLVHAELVPKPEIDSELYSFISDLAKKGVLKNFRGMKDVRQIIVDHQGNYWVSTNTQGVYKLTQQTWKTIGSEYHPNLNNVYGMYLDEDSSLWLAAFQNGIFRIQNGIATHYSPKSNVAVGSTRTFHRFSSDSLLAGGSRLVSIFESGNWGKTSFSDDISTGIDVIFKDSNGRNWVGTNKGLFRVTNGQAFEFIDNNGNTVSQTKAIIESKSGKLLYFATIGQGVAFYNEAIGFDFITTTDGLSSNQVRDVFEKSADTLWAVNEDKGLNRLVWNQETEKWTVRYITEVDGLSDNSLHKIVFDNYGSVWLNSNSGVIRLNQENLNAYLDEKTTDLNVEYFGKEDGLENIEGNGGAQGAGMILPNGLLVFPSQAGIILTDPKLHSDNEAKETANQYPALVQQLVLADSTISLFGADRILVPEGVHDFRIKFTALEFKKPEDLELWYKLDGFQKDWQKVNSERIAVLSNVAGGEYQFKLKVRYPRSSNYIESSISVIVSRRFYETIWFYVLAFLLVCVSVFIIVKWRTKVLLRNEKRLQQKVDAQTRELHQAAKEKERFFSGITHELKTPVSLIQAPLHDLITRKESLTEAEIQQRLQLMQRNSERLDILVDQVLEVTRIRAGVSHKEFAPINLRPILEDVIQHFSAHFQQKNIQTEWLNQIDHMYVNGNKNELERIFINLISNAIKYGKNGGRVQFSSEIIKNEVHIKIIDNGVGIPKEEQDKIFDYLYQVDANKSAGGTGIGLYLVKNLVTKMNGNIKVESAQGNGSTFVVILPLIKSYNQTEPGLALIKDDYDANVEVELDRRWNNNGNHKKPKVLVVEDNLDFREYLILSLSKLFEVEATVDGEDALKFLGKCIPDLVITDVMMPNMNGIELVENMRRQDNQKETPVIFLSAKEDETTIKKGLSTGADLYLTKPIHSEVLISQIKALLRRERRLKQGEIKTNADPLISKVHEIIYRHLANTTLSVNMIADALYMSRSKLYAEWSKVEKESITNLIRTTRLEEAYSLLKTKEYSIREVSIAVGYTDANYFSTSFKKHFGYSPSEVVNNSN